jgi:hypothetical protein
LAREATVGRSDVLRALSDRLMPLSFVHALWEGGAAGFGRLDEWSDIDLYALVDDDKVDESFAAVEDALRSVSPIKTKYDVGQTGYPGVHQAFYRLEDTSEFMVLDIAVVTVSAPDLFLEEETHGAPSYLFCKLRERPEPSLDRPALRVQVSERVRRLRSRMDLFHVFVKKEMNRGHAIEALDVYRSVVLGSLTEMLRIKHYPVHHGFQTRYVYSELPPDVVERLEGLYFVRDIEDLEAKYDSARRWFDELHDEVLALGPRSIVSD